MTTTDTARQHPACPYCAERGSHAPSCRHAGHTAELAALMGSTLEEAADHLRAVGAAVGVTAAQLGDRPLWVTDPARYLQDTADLMRQRAGTARAGRWFTNGTSTVYAEWQHGPRIVAAGSGPLVEGRRANAEHIAAWDPATAVTVADLLANEAALLASTREFPGMHTPVNAARMSLLLDVARAYRGDS